MNAPSPDPLSRVLSAWRLEPPLDPGFRAAVRGRITAGPRRAGWPDFARRHAGLVGGALALALVAGAAGGHGRARAQADSDRARLAAAYVDGLDARRMTPPR